MINKQMQCFNCSETGHKAMECPQPRKERTGDRTCYNCNQSGHISRDCPAERKPRYGNDAPQRSYGGQRDGGQQRDGGYNNGGYQKREYTNTNTSVTCYNCNKTGHISRDCPEERKPRQNNTEGGDRTYKKYDNNNTYDNKPKSNSCYKCGGEGHISRDCTQGVQCFKCKQGGHKSYECKAEGTTTN